MISSDGGVDDYDVIYLPLANHEVLDKHLATKPGTTMFRVNPDLISEARPDGPVYGVLPWQSR